MLGLAFQFTLWVFFIYKNILKQPTYLIFFIFYPKLLPLDHLLDG